MVRNPGTSIDIDVLQGLLVVIHGANDYSKKLLGKYMIVELNSLYSLMKEMAKFDEKYKRGLFFELEKRISEIDGQVQFRLVRDKIAAHRDGNLDLMETVTAWQNITYSNLIRYVDLFRENIGKLLADYRFEAIQYFMMKGQEADGIVMVQRMSDYVPFEKDAASPVQF